MLFQSVKKLWLAVALLLAGHLVLGLFVVPEPTRADRLVGDLIQAGIGPLTGALLRGLSVIADDANPFVIVTILAVLFIYPLGWKREAVLLLIGSALVGILNWLAKVSIGRARPTADDVEILVTSGSPAYPSGHATFALVFFGFLILVARRHASGRTQRVLVGFFSFLIVGVGVSRIYLGLHWLTDVLGGYLLGGAILGLIASYYCYSVGQGAASAPTRR